MKDAVPANGARCLVYDDTAQARPLTSLADISEVLSEPGVFVWLDVVDPQPHDFTLFQEEFGLHPLAIEDALKAHEQPKIEAYDESWFVVVQGATREGDELRIHEVSIFAGAKFIVTARGRPPYPLDEVERRWQVLPAGLRRDSGALLYTILDTVVDGYTAIAEAFEEHVGRLESALLGDPRRTSAVLLEIYEMKKELARFRRAVVPVRDILAPILRGDLQLFGTDELPYYRDVLDHVSRVVDQLDGAREAVNNARETHISLASHRQNEVAKQLTIVATVFLPLTFITGFFGQNFGWLVNHITNRETFVLWGLGSEVVGAVARVSWAGRSRADLCRYLRRRYRRALPALARRSLAFRNRRRVPTKSR
ncbi:MAG: magnesium transporter CorA family protein [Candidatus Velthaea sp.]